VIPLLLSLLLASAGPASAPEPGSAPGADVAEQAEPAASSSAADPPLRMGQALPPWLDVQLSHRSRVEALSPSLRGTPGGDRALFLRTLLRLRVGSDTVHGVIEGIDARRYGQTWLGTSLVDPVDLLQANLVVHVPRSDPAERLSLRLGRMTLDVGSRRLVARNRYRNTINAFTGVDVRWQGETDRVRLFAVSPVKRRPTDSDALARNALELDREHLGTWLLGAQAGLGRPSEGALELLILGLVEADTDTLATRDRRLVTTSLRWVYDPAPGRVDYEVEAVLQGGRSRAETTSDQDQAHRAGFVHAHLGYTFDHPVRPRIAASVDLASGDNTASDARYRRFDTLFGARRFAYGPTGVYGAFARSNLMSPELRASVRPHARVSGFVAVRPAWLASPHDAWVGVSSTPAGGRHLGTQAETRVRWEALPQNLRVEGGLAWLELGASGRDRLPQAGQRLLLGYGQVVVWL